MKLLGLAVSVMIAGYWLVLAAPIPKAKEDDFGPTTEEHRKKAAKNLKEIALAMHNYESAFGSLPDDHYSPQKKPLLSWRVLLLPYMEQEDLYREFKLNEPWDSDNNKKLIAKMPPQFAPVRVKTQDPGMTFYRGFSGTSACFGRGPNDKLTLLGITDGTSNTLCLVEAGEAVVWTKPGTDMPYSDKVKLPKLGGDLDGPITVVWWDGSTGRIKRDFDEQTFRAAVTCAGGESIDIMSLNDKDGGQ